jgi:hypothetical protein
MAGAVDYNLPLTSQQGLNKRLQPGDYLTLYSGAMSFGDMNLAASSGIGVNDPGFVASLRAGNGQGVGDGGALGLTAGNADGTGNGGTIEIISGRGAASGEVHIYTAASNNGAGGAIHIAAGPGGGNNDGGPIEILAGDGGDGELGNPGNGGDLSLRSGNGGSVLGSGGDVAIAAGSASTEGSGGNLSLAAGSGLVGGAAGSVLVNAGDAGSGSVQGGDIAFTAGTAGLAGGAGGHITLQAGSSPNGVGGAITVSSGKGGPTAPGGDLNLASGNGGQKSDGGTASLTGGRGGQTSGNGGRVLLHGGNAQGGGNGGDVSAYGGVAVGAGKVAGSLFLDAGPFSGGATAGTIGIGGNSLATAAKASAVYIGDSGANAVYLQGAAPGNNGGLFIGAKAALFLAGAASAYKFGVQDPGSGDGTDLQVFAANGVIGNGASLYLHGGATEGAFHAGNVVIEAGGAKSGATPGFVGVATDNAANVYIGGSAHSTNLKTIIRGTQVTTTGHVAEGGDVEIYGGLTSGDGITGAIKIQTPDAFAGSSQGGTGRIRISTGNAQGSGAPGAIALTAGDAGTQGSGAGIYLAAGGGRQNGTGGDISIASGDFLDPNGTGGEIDIVCGASAGDANGAVLTLRAGMGAGTGTGGTSYLLGGDGESAGGDVVIKGGAVDAGVNYGSVFIGVDPLGLGLTQFVTINSTAGTMLQANESNALRVWDDTGVISITVQNGAFLACDVDGMINLPPNFMIDGKNTSVNGTAGSSFTSVGVTANNLNVLTQGPTSDASQLHTHTGISGATSVVFDMTANEAIAVGAPVVAFDSGGANNAKNGNATTGVASGGDVVGLAFSAAAGSGSTFKVQTSGALPFSTGIFDVAPSNASRGKRVYCSTTSGKLTLTPPSAAGNFIQKVGTIVSVVGATVTVNVQIGDQVIL